MPLEKNQIKYIYDSLAAKGIYYEDLRHELTDHIASKVEQQAQPNDELKEEVIKSTINAIKPESIQRKRMMRSFLLPLQAFRKTPPFKSLTLFLAIGIVVHLSLSRFDSLSVANKWLDVIFIAMATLPALLAVMDQKWKPYKMSFFMTAVLGCHFVTYLLHIGNIYFIENYLLQSDIATLTFYTLGFGMIGLTYLSIYRQYQLAKRYVIY